MQLFSIRMDLWKSVKSVSEPEDGWDSRPYLSLGQAMR